MRINRYIALSTGISRRAADGLISEGNVTINDLAAKLSDQVLPKDIVKLNGKSVIMPASTRTVIFNKPAGYVTSRNGQGSKTIYDLLPSELHTLKPVGRLDKDSSGILLLTNDGDLANRLTHPRYGKTKVYELTLSKPLVPEDWQKMVKQGVQLEDGISKFEKLRWLEKNDGLKWLVAMREGRNRQIRRTFATLGYNVIRLHRTHFGEFSLDSLKSGAFAEVKKS